MAQIGRRDAIFPVLSSLTVTASLIPTSFERHMIILKENTFKL